MCCTVHSQLLCGKVGASLTLDLTCSLLGLKASGLAPDNQWYTCTVSTHAFVKMKDIIFCQHNKISHWFTITSDNFFFKSTLNVSRSTSPLVYSTKIQYTRRLIDIAVIRGHCLAKARSISILTVRLRVRLAAVHQAERVKQSRNPPALLCLLTAALQCPLFDSRAWEISRETGTAAHLYWNRLTQCRS